jgi:hypothetical protein
MRFIFLLPLISWVPGIQSLPTMIKKIGRGNFMFGRQAMNLLEFAARLCTNDATGKTLTDFSNELFKIDPKYFTQLPSPCASNSNFVLPHIGDTTRNPLLWALFDLIRHGLADQYQQLSVNLTDDKNQECILPSCRRRKRQFCRCKRYCSWSRGITN